MLNELCHFDSIKSIVSVERLGLNFVTIFPALRPAYAFEMIYGRTMPKCKVLAHNDPLVKVSGLRKGCMNHV